MTMNNTARTPDTDPATWGLHNALVLGIAHDFGMKTDHSTIIRGGAFALPGQEPVIAITSVEQLPLQTPPSEVRSKLVEARNEHRSPRVPTIVLIDATSNVSHFESCCNLGIDPMPIGLISTNSTRHATTPKYVRVGDRKHAREYSVSRTLMLDELMAPMSDGRLVITSTGDADKLRHEFSTIQRVVTEARNVQYKTPENTHDDLVVSVAMLYYGLSQALRLKSRFTGFRPQRVAGSSHTPNPKGWT